jgi:3-deoxy-manno-octulosonate cytidylyltransferase (CMP-KDO synthetase)
MKILGIIPVRLASTRLPGKPLIDICGKSMIQRVYEQGKKSHLLNDVVVAADDNKIIENVKSFGGKAILTSKRHKSGTDRICEVLDSYRCDIAVNIQGDEPMISPFDIDKAIKPMLKDKMIDVSTLAIRIYDAEEISDPNNVKVVFGDNRIALYFSRSVIPYNRDSEKKINYYKHIGLYVYRYKVLQEFRNLKQSKLEKAEKLEQLRLLENGYRIYVELTKNNTIGIDTAEDLKRIKNILESKK